ncbi:MAG: N-acetylmuramoyl-L-alanine amidase [Oscillochloridaceae bacterium umkhey_bin13]
MSDFPTEGRPPFINRRLTVAEWRTYVANYNFGRLTPSRLVLHHTYRPTEAQWAGLNTMRAMQRYFASKGWTAGPHIFVAPDGIWLATPMSQVGIHAGIGNGSIAQGWYSIGLEMVGAFDTVRPQGAVWNYALAVMGELSRRLQLAPNRLISFHRDYTNTKSCPGWAVSKEWVWNSVDAYLRNTAQPPAPPPDPGPISPADELLLERLLEESFRQRAGTQGYNPAWAFHQYAVEQGLGAPLAPSTTITEGGRCYDFQPFARETLYTEVPNWGEVRTLSQLLGGSIPPAGLGRRLLDETYRAGGQSFRPDWAFHQFAVLNRLGPALGPNTTLTVDGRSYAYQAFAADTLYSPVPQWTDVRQLSRLSGASAPADLRLRDALLAATFTATGQTYRPDWAFHQRAARTSLGAPLGGSYQITVEGVSYALQVFALDTLYNRVPQWANVRQMSALLVNQGRPKPSAPGVLGGAASPDAEQPTILGSAPEALPEEVVLGAAGGDLPDPTEGPLVQRPPEIALQLVRHTPQAQAASERDGAPIELIILHGVAGAAATALERMVAPGAYFATHYYVDRAGVVHQLVDEERAAWHAGIATADGIWLNLNRTSIGIGLERPAGWPEQGPGETAAQVTGLRWLLQQLSRRYQIAPNALLLWSSLAGSEPEASEGLPLAALREAMVR